MLGRPGDGWRVSLTTLMNERTAIGGSTPPRGSGPIASAVELWRALPADGSARRAVLDRLMQVWIEAEVIRLNNMRASNNRKMGVPGPEGSIGKLASAENNKRVYEVCMDLLGAEGLLSGGYDVEDDERPTTGNDADHPRLPAQPRQLDRGWHVRGAAQHPRRARARPPGRRPRRPRGAWNKVPRG